jgi:hypothetical protein
LANASANSSSFHSFKNCSFKPITFLKISNLCILNCSCLITLVFSIDAFNKEFFSLASYSSVLGISDLANGITDHAILHNAHIIHVVFSNQDSSFICCIYF